MTAGTSVELAICGVAGPGLTDFCDARAAADVVTGCVHEHIQVGPLCQIHIEELAHGWLSCAECKTCADPHICRIEVISLKDPR